jgi:hypothetical protein
MIRKLILISFVQFVLLGCQTTLTNAPSVPVGFEYPDFRKPNATKVVLVVLENTSPGDALNQPFLRSLADSGAYLSNYYAVAHPSQPNYVALLSGSTDGVIGDLPASLDRAFLGQKGHKLLWKVYAEGYPSDLKENCDLNEKIVTEVNGQRVTYVRKHVPQLSFLSLQEDPRFCHERITGFENFLVAAKTHSLPSFSLVIPSQETNAHDRPLSEADAWLSKNFGELLKDPQFKNDVLLIVTFDENDTKWWRYSEDIDNRVFAVLWGDDVKQGFEERALYTHYDLLRTIETIFAIEPMATGDRNARAIGGVWR